MSKKKTDTPKEEKANKQEQPRVDLLEQALKERDDFKEKYMRTLAEFENFRRRSYDERETWIKTATRALVLELCDVADNFERALGHTEGEKQAASFAQGVEMIYKQFTQLLNQHGVQKIEALGKEFDPEFCEALAHIPSEHEEGKIAAVIKNGYLMNEKLLRPCQVAVSAGAPEPKNNE